MKPSGNPKLFDVLRRSDAVDRLDEVIPGLIYIYDLVERRNVYANRSLAELLGYSPEQVARLGDQVLATIIHPEDLPRALAHHAGMAEAAPGQVVELEYRVRDGSGAWRWLHASEVIVARDDHGAPRQLLGLALDVTERVRVEADLRESQRKLAESEERWRSIAENPFDFVVVIDRDFKYTYVNFVAPGLRMEDLIGKKGPHDFVSPPYQAAMTAAFETVFREGRPTSYEVYADAVQGWYHNLVGPIRNAAGEVTHLSVLTRDITSEKNAQAQALDAEQQVRRMEAKLAQSAKLEAVGQLAGGIAHDFNNLLTGIGGIAELLALRLAPHPALAELHELRRAVQRGAALTRQLLAFSRQQTIAPSVLSLNALLDDTSRMLRRLIGPDVELVLAAPDPELCVYADASQLEQVLVNLAVNARDAMPGGGRLSIELTRATLVEADPQYPQARPGPYARLVVSDTGKGMEEATLARIFEPFFTTKSPGAGTGLGLSLVHGIVTKAGGFVSVRSRVAGGSSFEVWLPLVIGQKPAPSPSLRPPARGSETLLVVDDEEMALRGTTQLLQQLGYRVLSAASGEDALAIVEAGATFDLLLTDVLLPGINGPELAHRVAGLRSGVPVVFMSGYADDALAGSSLTQSGALFLAKPYSYDELASKVRAALDTKPARPPSSPAPADR